MKQNKLERFKEAARQLIESHDKGDLDGEAKGWIALRALIKIKE